MKKFIYLFIDNSKLRYVILNDDIISYDESIRVAKIPIT